jgi:hypothetical protein
LGYGIAVTHQLLLLEDSRLPKGQWQSQSQVTMKFTLKPSESAVNKETTSKWLDSVVAELSDQAAATLMGGGARKHC